MTTLTEADVEEAARECLAALGWQRALGPGISPGGPSEELADHGAGVLEQRLRDAPPRGRAACRQLFDSRNDARGT